MYKRMELRRAVGTPVEIITSHWDEPVPLVAGDMSPRGTYLVSDFMPDKGEHVICTFHLPTIDTSMCFFGEVTRVNLMRRKNDEGPCGFGINFLDATAFDRLRIRRALRGTPPPLPGAAREISRFYSVPAA